MMRFQSIRTAAGVAILLAAGVPALAATNIKPSELAVLPGFCDAKIGSQKPADVEYWVKQLKRENWDHMHHYCGGLIELNRYYGGNEKQRKSSLRSAMWEFDYVIKYTQPDFYLRPEMYYNRGKVWHLQGNDGQALGDLRKALELNPGMPSATIELADLYRKQGKKTEALALVKTALEKLPDSKGLRRRYLELGGDPSKLASPPVAAPSGETPAAKTPEAPAKSGTVQTETAPVPPETAQAGAAETAPQTVEPKIGNATNPWCRFCPDPAPPKSDKP